MNMQCGIFGLISFTTDRQIIWSVKYEYLKLAKVKPSHFSCYLQLLSFKKFNFSKFSLYDIKKTAAITIL